MNQNHLHLHVNVTNNTEFGTMDKISHMSRLSDHDLSRMNMSSIRANEVNWLKACNNEKLKLKKNNIQYTPLTINGILRDNIKPPPKDRLKTKSNDMESMSLSNSSWSKRIYIGGINSQTLSKIFINILKIQQILHKDKEQLSRNANRSISTKNLNNTSKQTLKISSNLIKRCGSPDEEIVRNIL